MLLTEVRLIILVKEYLLFVYCGAGAFQGKLLISLEVGGGEDCLRSSFLPLCGAKQSDPEIGIKKEKKGITWSTSSQHLRKQWLCLDFQTAFVKPIGCLLQSIFCTES